MTYVPRPLDTTDVSLPAPLLARIELLARNVHDTWAQLHVVRGWRYGPHLDEVKKEHPSLVPYDELPEYAKEYDRNVALQTVKAVLALGFRIETA